MLEEILNFIANPLILILIAIPVCILVGIYVGVWLTTPRKNRIIQIDPESGRGVEFEVQNEDTINAYCKPVGDTPPQRFIKLHKPYNITRKAIFKLQSYALWIGKVGTAYTQEVKSSPVKTELRKIVRHLFGPLYDKIPNDKKTGFVKDKIEKSEVAVTVELPAGELTPEGLISLSSDDIRRHDIDTFIGQIARGIRQAFKTAPGEVTKIVFILGSGIAIGIVLSLIFGWGNKTIIQESTAMTMQMLGV